MEREAVHVLKKGKMLHERYVIENVLGEGGFGITYRGTDRVLASEVAIKEYYPQGLVTRNNIYSELLTVTQMKYDNVFQKGKAQFLREARTLAKFNKEPGIVSVIDFFEENNTAYIVMEYLDGINLKDYVEQYGLLSANDILSLMTPVIEALDAVHSSGLIHRDISPDNIMLLGDGGVKLMDFGAARDYTEFGGKSLSIVLKHGYAPEEQYREHGEQGPWTDIYALCATMYKCITGKAPAQSLERMHNDTLQSPADMGVSISPQMNYALMKGLSVRWRNRYQNLGEFCRDLYGDGSNLNYEIYRNGYNGGQNGNNYNNNYNNQNNFGSTGGVSGGGNNFGGGAYNSGNSYNSGGGKSSGGFGVALAILAGTTIVLIIGIAILVWQMNKDDPENKTAAVKTETTTADNSAETTTQQEATTTEEKKVTLPYTDNESMAISECLETDDYAIVDSADGSFSFGYPKYVFNSCYVDEDSSYYELSYTDDSGAAQMELIVHTEDNPGNAISNTKELFSQYSSTLDKVSYNVKPKDSTDSQGMARGIISGELNGEGAYIIVVNNGKKNYILEYYFPDPNLTYDYDDVNYLTDCVYRYCSFGGTTYKPRTFSQFFNNSDMGTKK